MVALRPDFFLMQVTTDSLQTTLSDNASVLLLTIYVLLLAIFLGFELIGRVPATLHTPLMSGTNAIHGIVVLGAMIILGSIEGSSPLDNVLKLLAFIAVVLGSANVFGGVTGALAAGTCHGILSGPAPDPSGQGIASKSR